MTVVRSGDRPVLNRGDELPTLQRLVDRANGSESVTVLVNNFTGRQAVPEHTHDVEEVLVVTRGSCVATVDGVDYRVDQGDAVVGAPGSTHAIAHASDDTCTVVAVLSSPEVTIWSE